MAKTTPQTPPADLPADRPSSLWQDAARRFRRRSAARLALFLFLGVTLLSVAGPWFTDQSYSATDLAMGAQPPSAEHWFGTDALGRDLFVRCLYGGRISLGVGFAATSVALVIGVAYGAIAGYAGGRADALMMRFVDVLYALPFTILVILLTLFFEKSVILLFFAIGAVEWLTMARIVRGQARAIRRQSYVEAARATGAPDRRIILRHILPNTLDTILVYTTLTIPAVILLESVISFLGLGVQPPMSSWGSLIKEGAEKIDVYPWLLIFPATLFSITLLSLNLLGDSLRDALDPKSADAA